MRKKVSFDFDKTLERADVQEFAKELISDGIQVWICTNREGKYKDSKHRSKNLDLIKVAKNLGIPKTRIIFTNLDDKYNYLHEDFLFHLDDDPYELDLIHRKTNIRAISCYGNNNWKNKCLYALDDKIDFGRYEGMTVNEVFNEVKDYKYILWMRSIGVVISDEIINRINQINLKHELLDTVENN